jgi:hypothetical protein
LHLCCVHREKSLSASRDISGNYIIDDLFHVTCVRTNTRLGLLCFALTAVCFLSYFAVAVDGDRWVIVWTATLSSIKIGLEQSAYIGWHLSKVHTHTMQSGSHYWLDLVIRITRQSVCYKNAWWPQQSTLSVCCKNIPLSKANGLNIYHFYKQHTMYLVVVLGSWLGGFFWFQLIFSFKGYLFYWPQSLLP